MNQIDNFSDDESAMAIAAAAFAITTLEDEGSLQYRRTVKGLGSSLTTTKSEREDNAIKPTDSSTSFQMSSFNEAKEDGKSAEVISSAVLSDNVARKTAKSEQQMLDSTANRKNTEKAMGAKRPSRKTVTFTDTYQNDANSKISESRQEIRTGPEELSTIKPTSLPRKTSWDRYPVKPDKVKGVDAWEKEEIAKVNNRYEKRNATIMEWENEKTTKAKLEMEQMERGLEQRQAKAKQEYRDDMSRIDRITDERKRNDESKMKEKTQMIRARKTSTCFCL